MAPWHFDKHNAIWITVEEFYPAFINILFDSIRQVTA